MTTSANRLALQRSRPVTRRSWLFVAEGLGVAFCVLVVVPAFALGACGLLQFARKPAAQVTVAVATPVPTSDAPALSPGEIAVPIAVEREPESIAAPVAVKVPEPEF